jgi:hypothetical protein
MKKVSLALFICAMGLTLPISHYTFVRIIWENAYKVLTSVTGT